MKTRQNTSKTPQIRTIVPRQKNHPTANRCHLALLLPLLLFLTSCGEPCAALPATFSSYDEAITAIESARFSISESVNTSKSSFIRDADFYSCDGNQGYLILQFKENDYIFEGVPHAVWEGFKHADSFGEFYDRKIRGRYRFHSN